VAGDAREGLGTKAAASYKLQVAALGRQLLHVAFKNTLLLRVWTQDHTGHVTRIAQVFH
jgi:hypothetical protein